MDVAFLKIALQFGAQFLSAVFIHIESLVLEAHHAVLLFLNREAGVDEEGGVFLLLAAGEGHEADETGHHGADGRKAGLQIGRAHV